MVGCVQCPPKRPKGVRKQHDIPNAEEVTMHYRIELYAPEQSETDKVVIFDKPAQGWRPTSIGDIADALEQFATTLRMEPERISKRSMKITHPITDGGNALPIMVYSDPITD
jgi:hypothetical protein